jgi:hypothetical protein
MLSILSLNPSHLIQKKESRPFRRLCTVQYFYRLATKSVAIEFCLFSFAAFWAALRFVLQTLFFVEFLFTIGEDEFFRAVLANECFVGHGYLLCFFRDRTFLGSPETQGLGSGNVESL